MQALQAERADLRSIWEDRYNSACAVAEGADGLLPGLHPEVMEAIERRHDGGRVEVLAHAPDPSQGRDAPGRRERVVPAGSGLPRRS